MPVYVNRIFNNGTESEKKCFHYCPWKNANAEDESQGAFTMMGIESPKIFILCESEPGFQVDLRNKPWLFFSLKRSEYNMKNHKGLLWLCGKLSVYLFKNSILKRKKSSSRDLFTFIWQPLSKSGPKYKYPCLHHHHHLTIKHSCRMTTTTSRHKLKAH